MDSSANKLVTSLNLMRRLPPSKVHYNANALANLIPELAEDLLQKVDKPLELGIDQTTGSNYIKSEFNRDGDSFRSPYSNKYDPPISDGTYPSPSTRELEERANIVFQEYAKLYYGGGVSNIVFWDKEDGNIACAFLMKKEIEKGKGVEKGIWDSINIVDVKLENIPTQNQKKIIYSCVGSVIIEMKVNQPLSGDVNFTGSLTQRTETSYPYENDKAMYEGHLQRIGRLVEDMETMLRNNLEGIYLSQTQDSIFNTRYLDGPLSQWKKGQMFSK